MKTRYLLPTLLGVLTLTLSACRHKDLIYDIDDRSDVYVVFDWRNAPDANPSSMLAYFYLPNSNGELLYTFADINGGKISIPYGNYSGIGINGDNADRIGMRLTDDPDAFEVYTRDADNLEANAIVSRSVPRAPGTEDERMAMTPGMVWRDRQDNISIVGVDVDGEVNKTQVVRFYPEEAVCHYTVDILDVTHPEYIDGTEVDATLSGMAEGLKVGSHASTDVAVTMPFVLKTQDGGSSLNAQFLTFGECSTTKRQHILSVYVYLTDGTKWYHTYDVTDQVANAPDPRHVHIVVRGLDLPKPAATGSGFIPDVNDWNSININLPM